MSSFKDMIEVELRNSLSLLHSLRDRDQLSMVPEHEWADTVAQRIADKFKGDYVPFVSEVEEFNATMGKPNNYETTIPEEKEWMFVYNFILEELEEYKVACETGDIQEVQGSNMSKACRNEEEAQATVLRRSDEQNENCHFEKVGDNFIVYRTRDRKVMKNINYYRPDLSQLFTADEIARCKS